MKTEKRKWTSPIVKRCFYRIFRNTSVINEKLSNLTTRCLTEESFPFSQTTTSNKLLQMCLVKPRKIRSVFIREQEEITKQ